MNKWRTISANTGGLVLRLTAVLGLLAGMALLAPLQAGNEPVPAELPEAEEDSTVAAYRSYRSNSTWETLVSLPGTIAYLPLKLLGSGLSGLVAYVDETKLVQKTYDVLVTDDRKRGLYPISAPPIGFGAKFFQKGLLTEKSKLSLSASHGLRGRQKYQFSMKRIQLGGPLAADMLVKYHLQPDEAFFGIESAFENGSDVDDDRTNYLLEQSFGEVKLGADVGDRFSAKAVAGYEVNSARGGKNERYTSLSEVANAQTLPGFESEVGLTRLELEVRSDYRNRGVRPTSGGVALLRGGFFEDTGRHDSDFQYGFWKLTADVSQHLHLFYDRTLILRLAGEVTEPMASDKVIPFYYLSELGREETVRGFQRGRFREENMVLGSAEYRYPVWEILDAFLFADAGKVFADSKFSDSDWKVGYGFGLEIWGKTDVMTSLALGISEDGLRLYFGLNREL